MRKYIADWPAFGLAQSPLRPSRLLKSTYLVLVHCGRILISFAAGGDCNADGVNLDYPDVPNHSQPNTPQLYLTDLFPASNFTAPTPGTEGNERQGRSSGPGFANTDSTLQKSTPIRERFNRDFRVDFLNIFHRPNLSGFVSELAWANFARATSQYNPRWIQVGATFKL